MRDRGLGERKELNFDNARLDSTQALLDLPLFGCVRIRGEHRSVDTGDQLARRRISQHSATR
jgi:hypothetical protein